MVFFAPFPCWSVATCKRRQVWSESIRDCRESGNAPEWRETDLNTGKGIILYDFLAVMGGAERLTLDLARALENVELCVGYRVPSDALDAPCASLTCHDLSARSDAPAWRTVKLMRAFAGKTAFLSGYDWALFSGSSAPLAVKNHLSDRNLLYCHTIPRFAYDLKDYYLAMLPVWQRPLFKALIRYVRPRYENAVSAMDEIIVNSENVRRRLREHLGFDARVVHPPIDTGGFRWRGQEGYYLSTARLEDFKRVDAIVRAFLKTPDKTLVVASGGGRLNRLKEMARNAANITFTGWVGEKELRRLMGGAIATIYIPMDEDFGMSPVESMAAGKPVICVREGGLLETVVHGETGLFIEPGPLEEGVVDAVRRLDARTARTMRRACEKRARRFSLETFVTEMRAILRH